MNEPTRFRAGDTVKWSEDPYPYRPGDGWQMKYTLSGAKTLSLTARTASGIYEITITATQTASLSSGTYTLTQFVERGADEALERFTLSTTSLTVMPNLSTAVTIDARSHLQKVLESIKAVIEGRATKADEEFTINGRSLRRTPMADLVKLYHHYTYLVDEEVRRERLEKGLKTSSQKMVMHFR